MPRYHLKPAALPRALLLWSGLRPHMCGEVRPTRRQATMHRELQRRCALRPKLMAIDPDHPARLLSRGAKRFWERCLEQTHAILRNIKASRASPSADPQRFALKQANFQILLVGGDPAMGDALMRTLALEGRTVHRARSADEAHQLSETLLPGLVVIDLASLAVGGLAHARVLRDRFGDLPIFVGITAGLKAAEPPFDVMLERPSDVTKWAANSSILRRGA